MLITGGGVTEGARLAALAKVASVLDVLGDDAPADLFDAHRFLATGLTDEERLCCPDCGCRIEDHNAVNRLVGTEDKIAHCGGCGACWKTKNYALPKWLANIGRAALSGDSQTDSSTR